MFSSGQNRVKDDWSRLKPTNAVNHSQFTFTKNGLEGTPSASETGLNGWSTDPIGVDLVTLPTSEVGEYWPLVSP